MGTRRVCAPGYEVAGTAVSIVRARRMDKYKALPTQFAWHPYIPLGTLTLLAGEPGLGKSQLQAWIAAQVTRGQLEGDLYGKPASVFLVSAEDSTERTIVPRLDAAGTDRTKVYDLGVIERGSDFIGSVDLQRHIGSLQKLMRKKAVGIFLLDPIVSFIGEGDTHKDGDIRRALAPIAKVAEEENCAVLGIAHLNKGDSANALNRVTGSKAWSAVARSVLFLGAEAQDEEARHLVHVKANMSKKGPSLSCHVEEVEIDGAAAPVTTSRIVIDGPSEARASDLMTAESAGEVTERQEAERFLRHELADGRELPAKELQERAMKELNVSAKTLVRAKKRVGVESTQIPALDEAKAYWVWSIASSNGKVR
jgi:hypothetical protein